MERYDIWQNGEKIAHGMLARGASQRMDITEADLEWAVEEHGRCDNDTGMTAVISGSTDPGPFELEN